MDSKQRQRRVTLKLAVIIALALILVISGVAYVVTAINSDPELRARILDPELLSPITSLFGGTSSGASVTPSADSGAAAPALPSPLPTVTPMPTITATATSLYTDTPTLTSTPTSTPTVTQTPSRTPIPSSTFTPTAIGSGEPPPTSTPTASPAPTEITFPDCSPSGNSGFEIALMGLINDEREDAGLPAYSQQGQLAIAAKIHSTDMACNGFFSHSGSDGSDVEARVAKQNYSGTQVDENIYATGDTSSSAPELAFQFWMASPPTRASILNDSYADVGISYIYEPSSPFGGYFTIVFAQP
jgi:uncharacterized protein YkwD